MAIFSDFILKVYTKIFLQLDVGSFKKDFGYFSQKTFLVTLLERELTRALDGDAEDGVAARAVRVHLGSIL
jgi:hypothetical protein